MTYSKPSLSEILRCDRKAVAILSQGEMTIGKWIGLIGIRNAIGKELGSFTKTTKGFHACVNLMNKIERIIVDSPGAKSLGAILDASLGACVMALAEEVRWRICRRLWVTFREAEQKTFQEAATILAGSILPITQSEN